MKSITRAYKFNRLIAGICIAIAVVASRQDAAAQATVDLGTAESFAVLAGPAVTSTSGGTINGDLGVSPGNSFTPGAIPVTVNGNIHLADAVWIFQSASSLIAEPGSSVVLINGADACNVFWQVGSSATLRTDVHFVGTIMALEAITLETRAVLEGRALARTAAVVLDNNTITVAICEVPDDDEIGYTIEKTLVDANEPLSIGDEISFEMAIVNTGTVDLVIVELVDTYDTGQLQYVNAIPPSDDNVNDGVIHWANVGPLTAGASTQVVANYIDRSRILFLRRAGNQCVSRDRIDGE